MLTSTSHIDISHGTIRSPHRLPSTAAGAASRGSRGSCSYSNTHPAHKPHRPSPSVVPSSCSASKLGGSTGSRGREEETDAQRPASAVWQEIPPGLAGRAACHADTAVCYSRRSSPCYPRPQAVCKLWLCRRVPVSQVCRVELLCRLCWGAREGWRMWCVRVGVTLLYHNLYMYTAIIDCPGSSRLPRYQPPRLRHRLSVASGQA